MKAGLLVAGIVVAVGVAIGGKCFTTNNRAISLEEQINDAASQVQIQEKRRVDLVYNLVDTVKDYRDYEGSTLTAITEARSSVKNGDVQEAVASINAVTEAYPELKANESYQQLMTELSMTENAIAETRNSYNAQVKSYNKYIRAFPNRLILDVMGYDSIDAQYMQFNDLEDAPQNLFE